MIFLYFFYHVKVKNPNLTLTAPFLGQKYAQRNKLKHMVIGQEINPMKNTPTISQTRMNPKAITGSLIALIWVLVDRYPIGVYGDGVSLIPNT